MLAGEELQPSDVAVETVGDAALVPRVAAAQANPEAAAMLAPALMTALALRQLHADAAALW